MSKQLTPNVVNNLEEISVEEWEATFTKEIQDQAIGCLEGGKVLYFPLLKFSLCEEEFKFLSPSILKENTKNVSYNPIDEEMKGTSYQGKTAGQLKVMMQRYHSYSTQLLKNLLPYYSNHLIYGKTSFRPAEVEGRKTSYRKDDTRLHVDSFPSNPTKGLRILRIFTNVNPQGKPRVWRIGEPLEEVMKKFLPSAKGPIWGASFFLKALGVTKDYRTAYDHYMLQMHDRMKENTTYQENVDFQEVHFPAQTSWMVYTDQVSHAAMSGQHLFEQTFYLPVNCLKSPHSSPLKVLERLLNKKLI